MTLGARTFAFGLLILLGAGLLIFFNVGPAAVERSMNGVIAGEPIQISERAKTLHRSLVIGDWHSDATLWKRDLGQRSDRGHVDLPRLLEGNVALQMFTTVTKSPRGQNYHSNSADAADNITLLAIAQRWPLATYNNLTERALYQAGKIHRLEEQHPQQFQLIRTRKDLRELMAKRERGAAVVGGLLGTEGSHALEGDIGAVQRLADAGFTMMSLHHFFDNRLGGSLHGVSGAGLSDFGRKAVEEMLRLNLIIDVSHSSPAVVSDVLAYTQKPLVVSHTGFYGHCAQQRNISDELMLRIARAGGLIGVGYWAGAVCKASVDNIVEALRYGIDLLGVDHVALGSDFDGSVKTPFDSSQLVLLTEAMLREDFSESEIRAVMGGNMLRFLEQQLPE